MHPDTTKGKIMQNYNKPERMVQRRQTQLSAKKLTDQSFKKACDINNIVKQFQKTGVLPPVTKTPQYGDFSEVPTLETTFEVVNEARKTFMELPATIRKLIDNDPSKLETFIANADNKEICLKYGLLQEKLEKTVINTDGIYTTEKTEINDEKVITENSDSSVAST